MSFCQLASNRRFQVSTTIDGIISIDDTLYILYQLFAKTRKMVGTIIKNLSGRKLTVLVTFLLLCQVVCFLIGGLVAPAPVNAQSILGTVCKDTSIMKNDTTKWYYYHGAGKCEKIDLNSIHHEVSERDIVYAFQMLVPRESFTYEYSRWQQNLIGVLQVDILYHPQMEATPRRSIKIDARLAYRNKGDPDDAWKLYTQSREKRVLYCDIDNKFANYLYTCSAVPLFELGSLYHDYYLLNIRLPVDKPNMNVHIGHIQNLWVTVINQNSGFTKVWLSLKTVFFPCIIAILVWFWLRIHILERKPVLLEKMLLSLGIALCFLNAPIEYLTLQYDLPFILLLGDIIQGIFYAMLFSFWLVFAGEHMLIQDTSAQSSLKQYCRHLSAVAMGCISLFIFDICARGVQLRNPFYSIWVTDLGTNLALKFIILAGISTGVYFLFLCYMVWQAFLNISQRRQSLPSMSIYRFMFMMLATLLCAALTVIGFILGQVAEGQWKWDEYIQLEYTSAFFTGVYGMWNIYIFSLLILYAPSHKLWPASEKSSVIQNT
ncbi:protein wntless-like [Bicyclus anynana]|uniref:Protein wntless n=1 Tax=Bicyclus anynana TaxID=110368 RepID=A0ABM3M164_BICAN|nr:protein wntless-like [Bicyclus anynana]